MNVLPDSLPFWIGGALLVFWFIGAYNRLVRLRSAALHAYAALDAALTRQLEFVQARISGAETSDAPDGTSLRAATRQLATLLAATRLRPLQPAGMSAMATALHVMLAAWQRLHPDDVISFEPDGTLSRPAPLNGKEEPHVNGAAVPFAWPEPSAAAEIARSQFNTAVAHYNAAVAQFPALLVAWIMQLKPAAPLL